MARLNGIYLYLKFSKCSTSSNKRLDGGDVFEEGGGKTNRGRRAVERNNRVNR